MLCHATVDDISFSLLICILIVVHLTTTTTMVQHTTSTVHYLIRKVHDFTNVTLTKFVVAMWYFIQNYLDVSKYSHVIFPYLQHIFFLNEAKNHETQTLCNLLLTGWKCISKWWWPSFISTLKWSWSFPCPQKNNSQYIGSICAEFLALPIIYFGWIFSYFYIFLLMPGLLLGFFHLLASLSLIEKYDGASYISPIKRRAVAIGCQLLLELWGQKEP